MKKRLLGILVLITFTFVLFFNVKLGNDKGNDKDTKLENIKALACYSVEYEDALYSFSGQCCAPYVIDCHFLIPYPGIFSRN